MSKPVEIAAQLGYSHAIDVSDLPKNRTRRFALNLDETELAALADDLRILGVKKLKFEGEIAYNDQGEVVVRADLGATATQACVVTLEPVRTRIDEEIVRRFSPDLEALSEVGQMLPEEDENVDPLGDVIDLGLVLVESIALNLPDFPRVDGAELKQRVFAEPGVAPLTDEDAKPFAGLAALKDKLSKD